MAHKNMYIQWHSQTRTMYRHTQESSRKILPSIASEMGAIRKEFALRENKFREHFFPLRAAPMIKEENMSIFIANIFFLCLGVIC